MIDKQSDIENYARQFTLHDDLVKLVLRYDCDIEKIIRDADVYITSGNPNEHEMVEIAWNYKIQIRSSLINMEDVFFDIPITPEIEQWKTDTQRYLETKLFNQFPQSEYEYMLFSAGMGDVKEFFFISKQYKQKIKKKLLLIVCEPSRFDVFNECPYVDIVVLLDYMLFEFLATQYQIKDFRKTWLVSWKYILTRSMMIKKFLGLDAFPECHRFHVDIPSSSIDNAKQVFERMKLRIGKTVLLIPDGNFFGDFSNKKFDFFIDLAKKFLESDFDVVTNSQSGRFPDIPNVFLPFWESVAFIGFCGNIVSIQTGWVESICSFNEMRPINLHTIIPAENDEFWYQPIRKYRFFDKLQHYGDRWYEFELKFRQSILESTCPPNVDFHVHGFVETNEKRQNLIDQIVESISR